MRGLKKAIVFVLAFLILEICPFNTAAEAGSGGEDRRIIVAMGDSFSSGEGIEEFFYQNYPVEVKVTQEDWLAHRSQNSWSGMLKLRTLGGKLITMSDYHWDGKNGDTACWYFTAASGATTKDFRGRQGDKAYKKEYEYYPGGEVKTYLEGDPTLPPQMEIFNSLKGQRIDYVTLTLGGNDVGFADIMMLAASGIDFLDGKLSNKLNQEITKLDAPTGVLHNLENVYKDIFNETDKKAKIIVAGYPRLVPQALKKYEILSNPIEGAILYAGLFTPEERDEIINAVDLFNSKIEDLVVQCNRNGMSIYFVPVDEEFNGHEPGTYVPYLNGVVMPSQSEDLKDGQIFSSYSFHPNINGARTYAKCVQAKIDELEGVIGSGYCGGEGDGTNLFWILDKDGNMTITGSGRMADWSMSDKKSPEYIEPPWYEKRDMIQSVIIDNGTVNVGAYAFYDCAASQVQLPEGVSQIGASAFSCCFKLSELVLPESLAYIDYFAFYGSGLKRITIPDQVTEIELMAFVDCQSLTDISLPFGIQKLSGSTFAHCISLKSITIPESISSLNGDFLLCKSLTSLSLPESLRYIGNSTLKGCDSLTDIYYAGSEKQWNEIVIASDNEETLAHVSVHYGKTDPEPLERQTASDSRNALSSYKPLIEKILNEGGADREDTVFGKLADLNKDGTDELFVFTNGFGDHSYSVYTIAGGRPIALVENRELESGNCELAISSYRGKTAFIIHTWGAGSAATYEKYEIFTDLSMEKTAAFSATRGFRDDAGTWFVINGQNSSENQFQQEVNSITGTGNADAESSSNWMMLKELYHTVSP